MNTCSLGAMRRAARIDAMQEEVLIYGKDGRLFTERKRNASLRNLELAAAANKARHQFGEWHCATCGKSAPATVHQMRKTYCSKECMAVGYRERMRGSANPNFKNAGFHECLYCKKVFHRHNPNSKYCGMACRDQEAFHLRTNAKKDANHKEIVAALEAGGASVIDTSRALFGVPDLIVGYKLTTFLVEVKNPKTTYGRKGLNKMQKSWAKESNGAPVYILRTIEDVKKFLDGKLDEIDHEGGYYAKQQDAPTAI